eukprot:CAMPEP_0119343558 /NCGR_PEP_ID=MMETSP1333-20130426/106510_1 /TAXON_ID=418940 /ORGANISM="Scyphosphaera apsteinii, Strain RCC1455" /LENGTH=80 /DNA_ID=CAMNT_0007355953 /DNA_START=44 /DNA_END=286 /DNA_ORIENTATION=-
MATAQAVAATRKTLFRRSADGDELLTATQEPTESDEKTAQNERALVTEMLGSLREEVKEIAKTDWLFETNDPYVASRIKV